MSRKPILYTLYLFSIIFFIICIQFTTYAENNIQAVNGVMDLSSYPFPPDEIVELNGQWHFYWHDFINPNTPLNNQYFQMPGMWDNLVVDQTVLDENGFASIRLNIQTDGQKRAYGMRFNYIGTAYTLYVNGEKLLENGKVGKEPAQSIPYFIPRVIHFESDASNIEIIIHTSNYEYRDGDMRPIQFGTANAINQINNRSLMKDVFLVGSLIIMGLYHLFLYFFSKFDKSPFFLGLLFLTLALRSSMINTRLALIISNEQISWAIMEKAAYIGFFLCVPLFYSYFSLILNPFFNRRILKATWFISIFVSFITLFTKNKIYDMQLNLFLIYVGFLFIYAIAVLFRSRKTYPLTSKIISFALLIIIFVVTNDILYDKGLINSQFLTGFGILFFMFIQSVLVAKNYSNAFHRTLKLAQSNQEMYDEIRELNLNLEKKVLHRTQTISNINQTLTLSKNSIKNILDNADQGFLTFGADFIIRENFSQECLQIFQCNIKNYDFVHLLEHEHDPKLLRDVIQRVFQTKNSFKQEVYLSLLPHQFRIFSKVIDVQYKLITFQSDTLIMVILTDISDKVQLELNLKAERDMLHMVVQIVKNPIDFKFLLSDYQHFCKVQVPFMVSNQWEKNTFHKFYRSIHNFKGAFYQYGMTGSASYLNELETKLTKFHQEEQPNSLILDFISQENLLQYIDNDLKTLEKSVGPFFATEDTYKITEEDINNILVTLNDLEPSEKVEMIKRNIKKIKHRNIKELLKGYTEFIARTAANNNKKMNLLEVLGDDIYIDFHIYSEFFRSLTHVFRNMIDHGIEKPPLRIERNKSENGSIICNCKSSQGNLILTLSDDGQGLQKHEILSAAIQMNLLAAEQVHQMSDSEIYALILSDQLTTKPGMGSLSGRGYGMSAVKEALNQIHGHLEIHSEEGVGTTFIFTIPINH